MTVATGSELAIRAIAEILGLAMISIVSIVSYEVIRRWRAKRKRRRAGGPSG